MSYSEINSASKKTNTSYRMVDCNIDSHQKQLARERRALWADRLAARPEPLYPFNGTSYYLRGDA